MQKPKVYKPVVVGLAIIYGMGYGTDYFKDVPTKALSLMATANSTVSTVSLKMPDMINLSKEYDLRPPIDTRSWVVISPST
jgi:hypothetical protein